MTYFLKSGITFRPAAEEALDLHTELPVGTYIIKKDAYDNLYFEAIGNFTFTSKRYGDNIRHTERIFSTFIDRALSTGVMLAGEKGSGKSLLAKNLSIKGYENNIPTIIINEPWCGEDFNQLIQSISQPTIIVFDEFEKVYNRDEQEQILTLLDGTYPSKKLFVLTCNDKYRIDSHMRNRPGRIFYMIDFKGLSTEFIQEYCDDNLLASNYTEQVCKLSTLFSEFNFDMLKALVEEMNRYDESPQEAMELLNAKPEFDNDVMYNVVIESDGKTFPENGQVSPSTWRGNPLSNTICIAFCPDALDDTDELVETHFIPADLKELNSDEETFVFVNKDKQKLKLTRQRVKAFNYFGAF